MTISGFPGTPKTLRGGLVRIDPNARRLLDVVIFQYNPDTLTRTLQPRSIGGEPGDRLEVLRYTGPPHETIKFDAEIDATDQLEHPTDSANQPVVTQGLLPALAVLERLVTPTAAELVATDALFDSGTLEIAPMEAPLVVLVWGVKRVVPVMVSSLTFTEEAFDPEPAADQGQGEHRVQGPDQQRPPAPARRRDAVHRLPAGRRAARRHGHQLRRATAGTGAPAMSVSRYANVGQAIWTAPDGSQVPYLLRRLLPAPGSLATAGLHQVQPGERDRHDRQRRRWATRPLSWLLGDANLAMRPTQLAQSPGACCVIPLPAGMPGAASG